MSLIFHIHRIARFPPFALNWLNLFILAYKFLINHKMLQEISEALEVTRAIMKKVAAIDAISSAEYPPNKFMIAG